MKRSITIVINSLAVGGCEKHLATILPYLKDHWDIKVIVWGPEKGFFSKELEDKGIPVHALLKSPLWEKSFPFQGILFLIARIITLSRHIKPGIVHSFLPAPYVVGMAAYYLAMHKGLFIMSRRCLNVYQGTIYRNIEKQLHKLLFLATGNSKKVTRELHEEGIPKDKIRLIYNGVSGAQSPCISVRENIRQALSIKAHEVVIIYLANLRPYKGHEDFFQAISFLDTSLSIKILCVGRDDGTSIALLQQAQILGIGSKVQLLGLRHDVKDLLAASDISVLCSHQEGFSNAILESMAAGLPVIATDVGGNAEAVVHEETGYIVPVKDSKATANALDILIRSPSQRRILGDAGKKRAESVFSIEACVKSYNALYEEAFSKIKIL